MHIQRRLSKLEQEAAPPLPCTCKQLDIQRTRSGGEVVSLPPCPQHKRTTPVVVKWLANVSLMDL